MLKISLKNILFTIFSSTLLVGCINEDFNSPESLDDGPGIELQITSDPLTRATSYENPEKRMESVDLFFYSGNNTDSPVLVWHSVPTTDGKLVLRIPENRLTKIFSNENKCKVYAVVNCPETSKLVEDAVADYNDNKDYQNPHLSLESIRELTAKTESFTTSTAIPAMVMFTDKEDGDEVVYEPSSKKATGYLVVNVLSARIDLFVGFSEKVTGVDPTDEKNPGVEFEWTPYIVNGTLQSRAVIEDGVKTVRLGGWESEKITDEDYFTIDIDEREAPRRLFMSDKNTLPEFPWRISVPIYTYPNEWNAAEPVHRTKLTLKVYWRRGARVDQSPTDNELHTLATYFTIPVILADDGTVKIESNKYYRIRAKIQTLGDPRYVEPVEINDCYYEILDWGLTAGLPSDARVPRYLEVQKIKTLTTFRHYDDPSATDDENGNDLQTIECAAVMNNTTQVTIPYITSHPIEVESVKITYMDFYPELPDGVNVHGTLNSESDIKYFKPVPTNVFVPKVNGKAVNRESNSKMTFVWGNLRSVSLEELNSNPERTTIYIDEDNRTLTFQHPFSPIKEESGDYIPNGDRNLYTPYLITIVLKHVEHTGVRETVNIMQYPAIYLENTYNDGQLGHRGNLTGDLLNPKNKSLRGGVYINEGSTKDYAGELSSGNAIFQLGGIAGLHWKGTSKENFSNNPNMYIVNITQLSENDELYGVVPHTGDPRALHYNNNLTGDEALTDMVDVAERWKATGSQAANLRNYAKAPVTAPRLYSGLEGSGQTGQLSFYYPTKEDSEDEIKYMIAPIFRMNSTYGSVRENQVFGAGMTRERARQRCASYQELGYPAGRWRLPTFAEMQFMEMLVHNKIIPDIFGVDNDGHSPRSHWTAQGLYQRNENTGELIYQSKTALDERKLVRCVYDDWYWVKKDGSPDNISNNAFLQAIQAYIGTDYTPHNDPREVFVWGDKKKTNPQVRIKKK